MAFSRKFPTTHRAVAAAVFRPETILSRAGQGSLKFGPISRCAGAAHTRDIWRPLEGLTAPAETPKVLFKAFVPLELPGNSTMLHNIIRRKPLLVYTSVIAIGCALWIGMVAVLSQWAVTLRDVGDSVPLTGSPTRQISLGAYFVDADLGAKTVTVDWFPNAVECPSAEMLVNLYVDPLASRDNRAIWLIGPKADPGSLHDYPHDTYILRISIFALLASTNKSVGIILTKSAGTPVNSLITLNKEQCNNTDQGIFLAFDVSRSQTVVALADITVGIFVLLGFLGVHIVVAALVFNENVAIEMLVPIAGVGALVAVTSIRTNLPGAPVGFGVAFDSYTILPIFGVAVLLVAVLSLRALFRGFRAIQRKAALPDDGRPISLQDMPQNLVETVNELKNAVIEMRWAIATNGTRLGP
ncbi:hypothetical protein B0H13DRAFT_2279019 [Mycena leptocephala]|nr:hypothetical protein B0H13DRAFT_2279019 [Mycena leptocephala]